MNLNIKLIIMSKQKQKFTFRDYCELGLCYVSLFVFSSQEAFTHINSFFLNKYIINPISFENIFFISIALSLLASFTITCGVSLINNYSLKLVLTVSYLMIIVASLIMMILPYVGYAVFALIIYTIGTSISYFLIINFVWKMFPFHKGILCGCGVFASTLGCFTFRKIFSVLKPRINLYLLINIIICFIVLIAELLIFRPEEVNTIDTSNIKCNNLELSKSINDSDDYDIDNTDMEKDSSSDTSNAGALSRSTHKLRSYCRKLFKNVFNKKYLYIIISYGLITSSIYAVSTSYLSYGIINNISITQYNDIIYTISLGVFSIIWGVLYDMKGFKKWILFLVIIQAVSVILVNFSFIGKWMIFAVGVFNAISLSGVVPLFFPMAYKEIGGEYAIDGIAGISMIGGITKVIIPLMMKKMWISNLIFSGAYVFSCAFVIASGFIVNHYIYPDNRKNKEEAEKRKKEWLVQNKLRELRKE